MKTINFSKIVCAGLRKSFSIIGLTGIILLGVSGCSTEFDEPATRQNLGGPMASDPPKTSYGKMVGVMSDATDDAMNIIGQYTDIESLERSMEAGDDALESFVLSLPDPTTLTRKIGTQDRALEAGDETNLNRELTELKQSYDAKIEAILPDPSPAKSLPSVQIDQESIRLSDDATIPLKSLEGVAVVEVLNAVAKGEDPQNKINEIENDFNGFPTAGESSSKSERGLYRKRTGRWAGNNVLYYFLAMSESHRSAMRSAMSDWQIKTGGAVKFQEIWAPYGGILSSVGYLDMNMSKPGEATIGPSLWGYGYVRLKTA